MNDIIAASASATALGGAVGSVITALTAKRRARAEVDSIIATGAETTVQSALAVAAAQAGRADRAEAENRELRTRLDTALARVDQLQAALDGVRDELNAIRTAHDH